MNEVQAFMGKDHERLDGLLRKWMALRPSERKVNAGVFEEFSGGLRRHIRWEEDLLFPVFERTTGQRDSGPTAVMREEHRQIEEEIRSIESGLRLHVVDTGRHELRLHDILGEHNRKEEHVLYPWMDESIGAKSRREMLEKMRE